MGMFHFESDRLKNLETFGKLDEQVRNTKIKAINKKNDIYIVCLSEWMKKKSEASSALGRYPHYLIPNGLDLSKYPVIDRLKVKKQAGIDRKLKTFIIVGTRLDNVQKGFPLFIETINKLDRSDFQVISVGVSDETLKIRNDIKHIHFENISEVSKLNDLYSAADLTVIPSYEDNLPNVMLESFANGTPVMSFSNGGMAEHIQTGDNGILINKIGIEPLALALNDFLNNKYIFDNEKIREYARGNFSESLQTERYLHLYKEILKR